MWQYFSIYFYYIYCNCFPFFYFKYVFTFVFVHSTEFLHATLRTVWLPHSTSQHESLILQCSCSITQGKVSHNQILYCWLNSPWKSLGSLSAGVSICSPVDCGTQAIEVTNRSACLCLSAVLRLLNSRASGTGRQVLPLSRSIMQTTVLYLITFHGEAH